MLIISLCQASSQQVSVVIHTKRVERSLRTSTPVSPTKNGFDSRFNGRQSTESPSCRNSQKTPTSTEIQWREMLLQPFPQDTNKSKKAPTYAYSQRISRLSDSDLDFTISTNQMLLDMFNDNWYLRKELEKSEEERRIMAENARVLHRLQSTSQDKAMEEQIRNISDLQLQIADHKFAKPFLNEESSERKVPNRQEIERIHDDMRKNILNLSLGEHTTCTASDIRSLDSKESSVLKNKVLGGIVQQPLSDTVPIPLDVWVQSLVGAAICEWIFVESYNSVAMMSTPLLYAYRRALTILCE
jgi:hypothetical protein